MTYEEGESDETIWLCQLYNHICMYSLPILCVRYLLSHDVLTTVGVPYDGVDVNEEVVAVQLSLTVILSLLSCAGIVFSIACLVFSDIRC